jgi:hypothetical protein
MHAQETSAEPDSEPDTTAATLAEPQYAVMTGSNNSILATRLPVVYNGRTYYEDVTFALYFAISSKGVVTATATPTVVTSPTLLTANFEAGNYVGPSTVGSGNALITVSGPGVVVGGATEWSIAASTGAWGCTYPSTATFYVGPITSNPLYARLKAAGITSTAYSYGIVGDGPTCFPGYDWYAGSLIGLTQNNGTLTIVSFTNNANQDHDVPIDQITYTLK